jgi:hypothetical protein
MEFNKHECMTILSAVRFMYNCLRSNNKISESTDEFKLRAIIEKIENETITKLRGVNIWQ